jgi:hypothetical protein
LQGIPTVRSRLVSSHVGLCGAVRLQFVSRRRALRYPRARTSRVPERLSSVPHTKIRATGRSMPRLSRSPAASMPTRSCPSH